MAKIHAFGVFLVLLHIVRLPNVIHSMPTHEASKPALKFVVLHNNDMHSRFEQTNKYSSQCHPDEVVNNKCYGGFARILTLLKQYRSRAENGGPSVLFLNAGDTYTGTPWFTLYKDKIVAAFLNILKPDAISLGNHELDLGVPGLVPLLNEVNFPVLVANLNNSNSHPLFRTRALKRSVVFDIKGHKVGIIGYLTPETKLVTEPNDLEFVPEVEAINEEAETLRNKGVNIILALGHSGYDVDQEIAKNCPLVDVVIGGHTNTFLYNGEQPDVEKIDGPYPTVVEQKTGKKVPVVQAYAYTKYLGELELEFDDRGNLISWSGIPILLNGSVARDPEALTLLETYREGISSLQKQRIGETKVLLDGSECRATECNLGNLITDAMVYYRAAHYTGKYWTDAGIAFMQGGGIRASATIGNITQYDLITILPFHNGLVMVNVTGQTLLEALEHSVKKYTGDRGEFLQMSGIQVAYNLSLPSGHRVESVRVICTDCEAPTYQDLDPKKYYGVIISTFTYTGGDDFQMFQKYDAKTLGLTDNEALEHYLGDFNTVYPAIEWRVTLNGKVSAPGSAAMGQISIGLIVAAVLLNLWKSN